MFAVTIADGTKEEAVGVAVGLEVGFPIGVDFGVLVDAYQIIEVSKIARTIIDIAVNFSTD